MADTEPVSIPWLRRPTTRRAVLGGTIAASTLAAAYAAVGADVLGGGSGSSAGTAGSAGQSSAASGAGFHDSEALKKESVKISHLLRRAGFGVTRDEYDRYQSIGLEATQDELIDFTKINDDAALAQANQLDVTDPANRAAPIGLVARSAWPTRSGRCRRR